MLVTGVPTFAFSQHYVSYYEQDCWDTNTTYFIQNSFVWVAGASVATNHVSIFASYQSFGRKLKLFKFPKQ